LTFSFISEGERGEKRGKETLNPKKGGRGRGKKKGGTIFFYAGKKMKKSELKFSPGRKGNPTPPFCDKREEKKHKDARRGEKRRREKRGTEKKSNSRILRKRAFIPSGKEKRKGKPDAVLISARRKETSEKFLLTQLKREISISHD